MNRTIRNESRELLLKLLGVNLNGLSEQTRTEVRHIAGIENNNDGNGEETNEQVNISSNHNQIVPQQTI